MLEEADALAGETGVARARVLLERGRIVRRSHGDAAALPLLERAYEVALAADQHFIAADAAHSCALVGDMVAWTNRGLDIADRFDAARYWRGTLLLNLGDWQWERGEESLDTFQAALEAREQESRNPSLTEEARFGVARALRALGRSAAAVPLLEQVVAWVDETQFDQPEARAYRMELAAAYDDVRRCAEADAVRASWRGPRSGSFLALGGDHACVSNRRPRSSSSVVSPAPGRRRSRMLSHRRFPVRQFAGMRSKRAWRTPRALSSRGDTATR